MQEDSQSEPGTVVQPDSSPTQAPDQPTQPAQPTEPASPEPQPSASVPEENTPAQPPVSNWEYQSDEVAPTANAPISAAPVQWTASEFIEHSKSIGWYAILAGGTIALAALVFLLTKDKVATAVVFIVAIVFGILANHKPRELAYTVDETGIHIGEKTYPYANFKSFAVVQENAIESIWLMPLKRFMPMLTIYFDPKDEEKIENVLSIYLPLENHELDPVDRLLHKIRF